MLVNVLVEIEALKEKTFTYSVPSYLEPKVKVGVRVIVPFGNKKINGIVLNYVDSSLYDTKDIIEVLDDNEILSEELILLGKKMSKMYISPLMSCYLSMLPSALKFNKNNTKIKYSIYYEKVNDLDKPSRGELNILELFKNNECVSNSDIKNKVSECNQILANNRMIYNDLCCLNPLAVV